MKLCSHIVQLKPAYYNSQQRGSRLQSPTGPQGRLTIFSSAVAGSSGEGSQLSEEPPTQKNDDNKVGGIEDQQQASPQNVNQAIGQAEFMESKQIVFIEDASSQSSEQSSQTTNKASQKKRDHKKVAERNKWINPAIQLINNGQELDDFWLKGAKRMETGKKPFTTFDAAALMRRLVYLRDKNLIQRQQLILYQNRCFDIIKDYYMNTAEQLASHGTTPSRSTTATDIRQIMSSLSRLRIYDNELNHALLMVAKHVIGDEDVHEAALLLEFFARCEAPVTPSLLALQGIVLNNLDICDAATCCRYLVAVQLTKDISYQSARVFDVVEQALELPCTAFDYAVLFTSTGKACEWDNTDPLLLEILDSFVLNCQVSSGSLIRNVLKQVISPMKAQPSKLDCSYRLVKQALNIETANYAGTFRWAKVYLWLRADEDNLTQLWSDYETVLNDALDRVHTQLTTEVEHIQVKSAKAPSRLISCMMDAMRLLDRPELYVPDPMVKPEQLSVQKVEEILLALFQKLSKVCKVTRNKTAKGVWPYFSKLGTVLQSKDVYLSNEVKQQFSAVRKQLNKRRKQSSREKYRQRKPQFLSSPQDMIG